MAGHLKMISIIIGGCLFFKESLNLKQLLGVLLTTSGLTVYTFARMRELSTLKNEQTAIHHGSKTFLQVSTGNPSKE